jgi:hypothetical protein
MNRLAISPAASALFRALAARSGVSRDRILLSDVFSVDWRSLTFAGERHEFELRIAGPESLSVAGRMCAGLEDAEFSIPGIVVADIAVVGTPARELDGSTTVTIEALTVSAD